MKLEELFYKVVGVLIGITALADTQFELLKSLGLTDGTINWIRLSGLILALLLPSVGGKPKNPYSGSKGFL